MKKTLALLLTAMMLISLAACGSPASKDPANWVYAVEAGSAGEAAAFANSFATNSVDTQAKALMEVQSGTSDAALIDSLMAGAMVGEGTMQQLAETYGVQEALIAQESSADFTPADDSDVAYIQNKGTLIVGITDFAPMDYEDDNGEWIGFDADMAKIVAQELGVSIEFIEIDWDRKTMELDSKSIDVVWNGMNLTDAVMAAMECTNAYCNNAQVVVVKQ